MRELPPTTTVRTIITNRKKDHFLINKYELILYQVSIQQIKHKRKFKMFTTEDNTNFLFCHECKIHVTSSETSKVTNSPNSVWPTFIWYMIQNDNIIRNYGIEYIWKFVPSQWRYWWIEECTMIYRNNITNLELPSPFFDDLTNDIQEWDNLVSSYSLPELRDTCNKHLLAKVLCPFGFTDFPFKAGKIPMDILFQQYLLRCIIDKLHSGHDIFKFAKTAQEDFLRTNDDFDILLLNKKWKVKPSISIFNGIPYISMCHEHNKGSKQLLIHQPCQPHHNLASIFSDQLYHCVAIHS